MAENTAAVPAAVEENIDDEFGLALKGYLIARFVYAILSFFMVLGALVCFALGLAVFDELVAFSAQVNQTVLHANDAELFIPYTICLIAQTIYSLLSPFTIALFMIKKNRLFAFIDLGLFVVIFLLALIVSGGALLFNGSAWGILLILNPVASFIALFAGKHFKYMPFK